MTTSAGDGRVGFGPDGVRATDTRVTGPTGVTVDGAGNLFIAEARFARVRRVDRTTRIITTVAGKGVPGLGGGTVVRPWTLWSTVPRTARSTPAGTC